jgi:hypothetical protein
MSADTELADINPAIARKLLSSCGASPRPRPASATRCFEISKRRLSAFGLASFRSSAGMHA